MSEIVELNRPVIEMNAARIQVDDKKSSTVGPISTNWYLLNMSGPGINI